MIVLDDQPEPREGVAGPNRESERLVVPLKQSNVGGGKGPHFQRSTERGEGQEIDDESNTSDNGRETPDGAA